MADRRRHKAVRLTPLQWRALTALNAAGEALRGDGKLYMAGMRPIGPEIVIDALHALSMVEIDQVGGSRFARVSPLAARIFFNASRT